MHCNPLLASLLGVVALADGLTAQSATTVFDWPAGPAGNAGPFDKCVAARLHGEQRVDVVVLAKGKLTVWREPAIFQAVEPLSIGLHVADVATLAAEAQAWVTDRDALVVATPTGLWLVRVGDSGVVRTAIDRRPPWKKARGVAVADLTADGRADLLVLQSDGQTFDTKSQAADGSFTDLRVFEVTAPATVRAFLLAELDGDFASPELVVDDDLGLRVYDSSGVELIGFATLQPDLDEIALLRGDAGAGITDRILFTTAATATPQDPTRIVGVADLTTVVVPFLTVAPVQTLVGGEFDGDGLADAASVVGPEELLVLLQQTGNAAQPFDPFAPTTQLFALVPAGAGSAEPCAPLLCDLGGDGADDLFLPIASDQTVRVFDGPLVAGSVAPAGAPDWIHGSACGSPVFGLPFGVPGSIALFVRAQLPGAAAVATDPSWQLETRVYVQKQGAPYLAPVAVSACQGPVGNYLVGSTLQPGASQNTIEIGFAVADPDDAWFVTLRLVHELNGLVTAAGPSLLGCFTADPKAQLELESTLEYPGWNFEGVGQCGVGGNRVGGFIRLRRMPKTPPGSGLPPPPPSSCHEVSR